MSDILEGPPEEPEGDDSVATPDDWEATEEVTLEDAEDEDEDDDPDTT